jgi:hypothetical protein
MSLNSILKIYGYRKRRIMAWKNSFIKESWMDIWAKDPSTCPFCKDIRIVSDSGYDYYKCLTKICGESTVSAGTGCLIRLHEQFIKSKSE